MKSKLPSRPRLLAAMLLVQGSLGVDVALAQAAGSGDRLRLTASSFDLDTGKDGYSAAVGWLHNFDVNTLAGVAVEHDELADSEWTFGSLTGSKGWGEGRTRTTLYGEYHRGSGDSDSTGSFDYQVAALGLARAVSTKLTLQFEDRQIDIDTSHGNLIKPSVSLLFGKRVLANLAYSQSIHGNLGTRLWSARVDVYSPRMNVILGGAGGKASPAIFDISTGLQQFAGADTVQGFLGFQRTLGRAEWTLLGDYLEIESAERITLTLNCMIRLGGSAT